MALNKGAWIAGWVGMRVDGVAGRGHLLRDAEADLNGENKILMIFEN